MAATSRNILLGEIGAAHGIKGEVSVRSFTENPADIARYGPLADAAGKRTFTLTSVRVTAKGVIARIAGIDDRTAAEKLRNIKLYVPRDRLPAPEEGAYYYEDLIGIEAVDDTGRSVGTVAAVVNYGAGDLIEIARPGEKETLLLPFTNACVPDVDLAARRLTIQLPDYTEAPPELDGSTDAAADE